MEEIYLEAARKLARTENPQTSKDAAKRIVESGELSRQEQRIFDEIKKYIEIREQFTTKDIALNMSEYCHYSYDKCYDICRKRFSGLRDKGKIELVAREGIARWPSGEPVYKRRDGCRIWRLT